ncbi:sororin [Protobothrops mucrosquamatus]|uniref:sororin n=1 Tax=Protobothrops mucrosquamatus TaxID=103944 RepID=UPI0010FB79CD|nr:sororin [Protobothrops mucrosquamatus]
MAPVAGRASGGRPDVTSGEALAGDFNGAAKRFGGGGGRHGGKPPREAGALGGGGPGRRRSERNLPSSTHPVFQDNPRGVARKMMGSPCPAAPVVRTITLRKIKPRNQQISLKENKENSPPAAPEKQPPHGGEASKKAQPFTACCPLNLDAENSPTETNVLSLVSANTPDSPPGSERDLAMAKRVRRSYSRLDVSLSQSFTEKQEFPPFSLAGTSTPAGGPGKRQTLFGFEKLLLEPSALHTSSAPKTAAAESGAFGNPDTDIPGISFGREKRRRKKMPQFGKSEMDEWAAQMNAEFEEAEKFDLLVE